MRIDYKDKEYTVTLKEVGEYIYKMSNNIHEYNHGCFAIYGATGHPDNELVFFSTDGVDGYMEVGYVKEDEHGDFLLYSMFGWCGSESNIPWIDESVGEFVYEHEFNEDEEKNFQELLVKITALYIFHWFIDCLKEHIKVVKSCLSGYVNMANFTNNFDSSTYIEELVQEDSVEDGK